MRIFLILFDSLRKDHIGKIYGNDWIHTPNFDSFARDCYIFEKVYPESLPTIPVRRAIHTGIRTFPFKNDVKRRTDDVVESPGWTPIPDEYTHISEYLNSQNYITSFITSTYHQFKPNMNFHLGFDEWHFIRGQEFDKYKISHQQGKSSLNSKIKNHIPEKNKNNFTGVYIQKQVLKRFFANTQYRKSEEDYIPAQTFSTAIKFVEENKNVKNIFCFIDEFDPHEPWDPPRHFYELYCENHNLSKKIIMPIYGNSEPTISESEFKSMKACYAGEVSFCDTQFGLFIEKLKLLDLYEECLIILTSDHGFSFGEHGVIGKIPQYMYPELVDIPLLIKPPGNLKNPVFISDSYIYTLDILPTIFGFLRKEVPNGIEGINLEDIISRSSTMICRMHMTCGYSLWTLYKDDNFAFITKNDNTEHKLYDLSQDANWQVNIAENNLKLCNELFNKIAMDAKGNLLRNFQSSRFEKFVDWYDNTYLM